MHFGENWLTTKDGKERLFQNWERRLKMQKHERRLGTCLKKKEHWLRNELKVKSGDAKELTALQTEDIAARIEALTAMARQTVARVDKLTAHAPRPDAPPPMVGVHFFLLDFIKFSRVSLDLPKIPFFLTSKTDSFSWQEVSIEFDWVFLLLISFRDILPVWSILHDDSQHFDAA